MREPPAPVDRADSERDGGGEDGDPGDGRRDLPPSEVVTGQIALERGEREGWQIGTAEAWRPSPGYAAHWPVPATVVIVPVLSETFRTRLLPESAM